VSAEGRQALAPAGCGSTRTRFLAADRGAAQAQPAEERDRQHDDHPRLAYSQLPVHPISLLALSELVARLPMITKIRHLIRCLIFVIMLLPP
jgi:hypothetical protein